MAEFPALPLWTDAFLSDTGDLTDGEIGVYLVMLMIAWRRPDCALPSNLDHLKRLLGGAISNMHGNRFNRIVPGLLERFWTLEEGKFVQKRLRKERDFLRIRSEKNSEKARKRWATASKINDLQMPQQSSADAPTPTPTPTPTVERKEGRKNIVHPGPGGPCDWPTDYQEQFWNAYPRKAGRKPALARLEKHRKIPWQTIMDGVRRYAADPNRSPEYTKLPLTWINQESWNDEPLPEKGKSNGIFDAIDQNTDRLAGRDWPTSQNPIGLIPFDGTD